MERKGRRNILSLRILSYKLAQLREKWWQSSISHCLFENQLYQFCENQTFSIKTKSQKNHNLSSEEIRYINLELLMTPIGPVNSEL